MSKGTKGIGGGVNGMHLTNTSHPFKGGGGRVIRPPLCKTVGLGPNPGGDGDKISANSAMKKKRPLNGPGDAK